MAEIIGRKRMIVVPSPASANNVSVVGLLGDFVNSAAAHIASHPEASLTRPQLVFERVILSASALILLSILFLLVRILITALRALGVVRVRELPKKMR